MSDLNAQMLANQEKLFSKVNNVAKEQVRTTEQVKFTNRKIVTIEKWIQTRPTVCPLVEKKDRTTRNVTIFAVVVTASVGGFKILDIIAHSQGWW